MSDDEDDLLPHIEKASLFRWRHQARLEKMAEVKREKSELKGNMERRRAKLVELEANLEGNELDEVIYFPNS